MQHSDKVIHSKTLHGALVSVYQENCQRTALILSTVNECTLICIQRWPRNTCAYIPVILHCVEWFLQYLEDFLISCHSCVCQNILSHFLGLSLSSWTLCVPAAILDDPMECSRGERLAITLAKDNINRSSNRSTTGKLEVDIFELLRDSEYETGETSEYSNVLYHFWDVCHFTYSIICIHYT